MSVWNYVEYQMQRARTTERERVDERREEARENWDKDKNQQRNNNGNQVEKEGKKLINIKTLLLWERSWSASSTARERKWERDSIRLEHSSKCFFFDSVCMRNMLERTTRNAVEFKCSLIPSTFRNMNNAIKFALDNHPAAAPLGIVSPWNEQRSITGVKRQIWTEIMNKMVFNFQNKKEWSDFRLPNINASTSEKEKCSVEKWFCFNEEEMFQSLTHFFYKMWSSKS